MDFVLKAAFVQETWSAKHVSILVLLDFVLKAIGRVLLRRKTDNVSILVLLDFVLKAGKEGSHAVNYRHHQVSILVLLDFVLKAKIV